MRRRPPHLLHLSPGEVAYLKTLVEDGRTEQRIARRARVLLAMADVVHRCGALAPWMDTA